MIPKRIKICMSIILIVSLCITSIPFMPYQSMAETDPAINTQADGTETKQNSMEPAVSIPDKLTTDVQNDLETGIDTSNMIKPETAIGEISTDALDVVDVDETYPLISSQDKSSSSSDVDEAVIRHVSHMPKLNETPKAFTPKHGTDISIPHQSTEDKSTPDITGTVYQKNNTVVETSKIYQSVAKSVYHSNELVVDTTVENQGFSGKSQFDTYPIKNKAGFYKVGFQEKSGDKLLSFSYGDAAIILSPSDIDSVDGKIEGNTITYEDAYPDADIRYTAEDYRLKEEIIVKKYNGKTNYEFQIDLSDINSEILPDGEIKFFKAGSDKPLFYMAKSYAMDNQGSRCDSIKTTLSPNGELQLSIDSDWLAKAVYPVIIDPTIYLPDAIFSRNSYAYKLDGTAATANLPRYEAGKFGQGIMIEEGTSQLFPSQQSVSFSSSWTSGALNGTYTVSIRAGTGKLLLSGGASGEVTVGNSLTFSVSGATVTFTPSGGMPQRSQLEQKNYATQWQNGANPTRLAETLTLPLTDIFKKGNWTMEMVFIPKDVQAVGSRTGVLWNAKINSDNYYILGTNQNGYIYGTVCSSGTQRTIISNIVPVAGTSYAIMFAGDGSNIRLCVNGTQAGNDTTYIEPAGNLPTNMYIGSSSTGSNQCNGIIDDLRISTRARTVAEHQEAYGQSLPIDEVTSCKMGFDGNIQIDAYSMTPVGDTAASTFTRSSVAYLQDGTQIASGDPRHETLGLKYTETTQADFGSGTLNNVVAISAPALQLSKAGTDYLNTASATADFTGTQNKTIAINNSEQLDIGSLTHDHSIPVNILTGSGYTTSGNGAKIVVDSNGILYSVYSSGGQIYCKKSTDHGSSWSNTSFPVIGGGYNGQGYPSIAIDSSNNVHVVWQGNDSSSYGGYQTKIKYSKYNGSTWSAWVNIQPIYCYSQVQPSIAIDSSSNLHVVWSGADSSSNSYPQIKYSKYNGSTWSAWVNIHTITRSHQQYPSIAIDSSNNLHVVWNNHCPGETWANQINYSKYNGSTWSPYVIIQLVNNYAQSSPTIAIDNSNNLHVVWSGTDSGNSYPQIKYSKYNGSSWSAWINIQPISGYEQSSPVIAIDSGNKPHVVWYGTDPNNSYYQIKYTKYNGTSWSTWTNYTTASANEFFPGICLNYKNFTAPLIIWQDGYSYVKFRGVWGSPTDYLSGTYTHVVQNVSGAVTCGSATLSFNKITPANTTATVDYRLSANGGTSWGNWNTNVSSGVQIIPKGTNLTNYRVQWRINMSTTNKTSTPSVSNVGIHVVSGYKSSGYRVSPTQAITREVLTAPSIKWTANTPAGTTLQIQASWDQGTTWHTCTNGQALPGTASNSLILKETLSTTDVAATPQLQSLAIEILNGLGQAIIIEEGTTNLFPQARSESFGSAWTSGTLNGTYTVSVRAGTGKLSLSGGATGEVTVGNSLTFSVSNATVTFIPSGGTPLRSQLEQKPYSTSWQNGANCTRNAETLTVNASEVFNKGNWTVELLFAPIDATTVTGRKGHLFSLQIDANNYYDWGYNSNGYLYLTAKSGGTQYTITDSSALTIGSTYTLMIAGNGSVMRMCKNGSQIGSDTPYIEPAGTLPSNVYIGSDSAGANQINGLIDEIRISNRARTLTEHQAAYNSGQALPIDDATTLKMNFDGDLYTTDLYGTGILPYWNYTTANLGGGWNSLVNTFNLNLLLSKSLFSVPGRGITIGESVTYNSIDGRNGPLGIGWHLGSNASLTECKDGSVVYNGGDGSAYTFTPDGSGGYTSPAGIYLTLSKISAGSFTITDKNRNIYSFQNSRPTQIIDRNNNTTVYTYNSDGRLAALTDPSGRTLTYAYNNSGQITSVNDPASHAYQFTYQNNRLSTVTDPDNNTFTLAYDADGHLSSFTDPLNRVTTFACDSDGQLQSMKDARTTAADIYQNSFSQGVENNQMVTTVTDPAGHDYTYYHDMTEGNLIKFKDPLNNIWEYVWSDNNLESAEDAKGITSYTYDSWGNVLTKTQTVDSNSANNITQTMTYDQYNQLIKLVDGGGREQDYKYDVMGNLIATLNSDLKESNGRKYDQYGNVIEFSPKISGNRNLLYNGSFERWENNNPMNWTQSTGQYVTICNEGFNSHGNSALKMVSSRDYAVGYLYQRFYYIPSGIKLTLRADLKFQNIQGTGGAVIMINYGSYYDSWYVKGTGTIPLFLTSQVPSCQYVDIKIGFDHANGTVWFDGLQLEYASSSSDGYTLSAFNSVEDSSFEASTGLWYYSGGASISNTEAWDGGSSLKTMSQAYVNQAVPTYGGESLTFSGMVKTEGLTGSGAYFGIIYYDGYGESISVNYTGLVNGT